MAASLVASKEDDLESIEILSAQYRPTHSVVNHGPYSAVNGRRKSSSANDFPVIRSVDDYEKDSTYYFRPGTTGSSSSNRPGGTNAAPGLRSGRRRSETLLTTGGTVALPPDSSKSTLIAVPIYNGDTVLVDTSYEAPKEPLSAEERKRKRITLAVGIIAGLIIFCSILLVAVTLNMTGKIDALVKEQSDTLYAQITGGGGDFGLSWKNASSAQNYPVLQFAARDNR